ncbi:geranylgeranyl transferase type-1 subunit beta isoform X2 [Nilaparvata lugens]|uniref:geranylgeranyl transferase type-1 subunit beta isoform X2 n=1 Tax=Nilaparvata lugens TaxID=108931 RepID=UPI00193D62C6|nr:geranylgeranyl transferase type-1 subunit beta isoform X2 [Nilaparvata lugens]
MSPDNSNNKKIARTRHIKYFTYFLDILPARMSMYDSIRVSIAFFAISGLDVLDAINTLEESKRKNICDWLYSLQVLPNDSGDCSCCGFQGSSTLIARGLNYQACGHLAMTYTALACLIILGDDLSRVDKTAVLAGVRALQQQDGSFRSTMAGSENDMRFVYCASCICYMLKDWSGMDVERTVDYIVQSLSYDGGIGQGPHSESHGGSMFCAVASLTLMGRLHTTFNSKQVFKLILLLEGLRRWAIMRQENGFQGRPNKEVDTCYSFWVGATLKMLDMLTSMDFVENRSFVMSTQHDVAGGFSKFVNTVPDPLHTYLGLSGLSLMGEKGLLQIHPALNITERAYSHLQRLHDSWPDTTSQ